MEKLRREIKLFLQDPKIELDLVNLFNNLPTHRKKREKSLELAQKSRLNGNKIYASCRSPSEFHNVYAYYAKSIAYAPAKSREMALAYANLSAVLFRLEKHSECLQAIDCCFNSDYPEKSKFKIYLRKIECLKTIDENIKATEAYDETLGWIEKNEPDGNEKVAMKKKLEDCYKMNVELKIPITDEQIDIVWDKFSIGTFNKEVPGVSDALDLKYSETLGRHFVATRDIRTGEMLLKDRPYSLVCSEDQAIYQCCWGCHDFAANCIPCETCENVIFCSAECREQTWKEYHHLECEVLSHFCNVKKLTQNAVTIVIHAFRILLIAIREYGTIQKLREALDNFEQSSTDPRTSGFTDGQLLNDKYLSFYSRKYHNDIKHSTLIAAGTMYLVATTTTLLGTKFEPAVNQLDQNEDFVFTTSLIARHLNIVRNNHGQVCHITDTCITVNTGSAISIPGSMFNHSCCANAFNYSNMPYTKIMALRPIKKGEEITVNYFGGRDYTLSERRQILQSLHHFTCNCDACRNDWLSPRHYQRINESNEIYTAIDFYLGEVTTVDIKKVDRNNGRDNKFMTRILKNLSETISKLIVDVPLPCAEVKVLQDVLCVFLFKLHNAYYKRSWE